MSDLIPRLSLEQMPEKLAEMLAPRVKRLGYLGEFFQCAANQPDALICFQNFTEALKKALPDRLTEVVALTSAQLMGNAYERTQHERLSLNLGFGQAWVNEVLSLGESVNGSLLEPEIAVQRLVAAVIQRRGYNTRTELERVIFLIGHEKAVAVLMLIGRYITHAFIVNSLELPPPPNLPSARLTT
jgi:Carboxymuconolactone decarboxylase family